MEKGAESFPRAPVGSLIRAKLEARPWDAPAPEYLPPAPPGPPALPVKAAPPAVPAAGAGGAAAGSDPKADA
jgi:hypothetical protein